MTKKRILNTSHLTLAKEYLLITLGLTLYALGWALFLTPNSMLGGGVTGFSALLQYATGGLIHLSVTYFVMNILLLLIGTKVLGTGFGAKTIFAIIMTSIMLELTQRYIPTEFTTYFATQGEIVCAVLGGIMAGVGIGLSMSQGGSTGGTDIIALVWCKFRPASPGKIILIIDVIIILSSLLLPLKDANGVLLDAAPKVALVIFGLMQVAVCGYAIDLYISGSKQSVQVFIFTKKVEEMADAIAFDMKRGVTVLPAKGWYSKEEKQVIMVVTRKADLNLLLRYVKTIDSEAFLSVSSVMGVYGQGFDTIKVKTKR
ncbi:MAG: YitT family protein [Bacteroidales bacterium]|nr:YitT family protein [Bacteroidales bacterium]